MSNSVGKIFLDLELNPSKFKKQMSGIANTAKSSTDNLTGMFKKVGTAVVAAFSVKAIADFSKQCLQLGSDLAEVQNVVDVTFGEMSGAVDNWAKNAMTSFGMSEKVAKEYVGQLGAMSKAFGNSTQEAYNQATSLAGLVGDVASFYNLTTEEAFTKLKAVYTGETEALKSLGVVMTQAALDEYALAKGYGKTTNAMSEQEKVALRLAFVTDRLSGASGDFVRTADGWANQTRVLKLRFDALKASIGQGLINTLLPVVRVLNTILERLQVVADSFSNFMGALFGNAGSNSSAISSAAAGSEVISSSLGDAESSAKAIKKSLAGFDQINVLSNKSGSAGGTSDAGTSDGPTVPVSIEMPEIQPMDVSFLSPVLDAFKSFVSDISPFIDTLKGIFSWLYNEVLLPLGEWSATSLLPAQLNVLGGAFSFINEVLLALQPMAEWLWNEFLQPLASWTGGVIVDVLNGVGDGLRGIGDWISKNQEAVRVCTGVILAFVGAWKVTELLGWLGMVGGVSGAIKILTGDLWANFAAKVANKAEDMAILALYAKDYIVALGKTIANIAKSTIAWVTNTAAKVASTAAEWAQIAATTAWNAICAIATAVTTAFGAALTFLTSPIGLVVIAIVALIAIVVLLVKHWDEVKEACIKCWEGIKKAAQAVADWFVKIWEGIRNFFIGLWDGIKKIVQAVIDWYVMVWTAIFDFFVALWEGIRDVFIGLWEGIKKVVKAVIDWYVTVWTAIFDFFIGLWEGIKKIAVAAWEGIKNAFSSIGSWFGDKVSAVKSKFSDMWSNVKNGAKNAWDGIKNTFSNVSTWFKDKFSAAWTAVKNVFSKGGQIFDGIKDGIVNAFKKVVNGIITGINKVVKIPFEGLNKVLDKIHNLEIAGVKPFSFLTWRAPVPQIPQLATGGYVAANTPQLAIIGDNKREGEIVAPESKITEAVMAAFRQFLPLFNNGGNNKPIYLTLKLGDGTFWEGFVDYHNDIVKRTGDTPLLI